METEDYQTLKRSLGPKFRPLVDTVDVETKDSLDLQRFKIVGGEILSKEGEGIRVTENQPYQ